MKPPHPTNTGAHLFCGDLLYHVDVQIALGQHLLQPRVLGPQLALSSDLIHGHLLETLAPRLERLLADAVLLRRFRHR
jgi:hypothetical protein